MNAEKIVFYAGKGGVGKSPLVVELTVRFARMGKRVLIVDLDGQAQATSGIGAEATNGLYDLVSARVADIKKFIVGTRVHNVSILTSGDQSNAAQSVAFARHFQRTWLDEVLRQVASNYDVILIDTAQGGLFVEMAIAAADMIVSPVRCQYSHVEALVQTPLAVSTIRQSVGKLYPQTVVVPIGSESRHAEKMFAALSDQVNGHQIDPTQTSPLDYWMLFSVKNATGEDVAVPSTTEIDNARGRMIVGADGQEVPAPLSLAEYRPRHPVTLAYNQLATELASVLWGGE